MREFWKAIYRWKRLERQIPYPKDAIREAITQVLDIFETLYEGNRGYGEYLNLIETASRILDERFKNRAWTEVDLDNAFVRYRNRNGITFHETISDDGSTVWTVLERPFKGLKRFLINHFPVRTINSPYDCTGEWFSWKPTVHRTPTGITIHQHWGRDV